MTRLFSLVMSCCLFYVDSVAQDPIEISFSHSRGFYDSPFALKLASKGADIWYTTDGSLPFPDSGEVYKSPLKIQTTSVIRAMAVNKEGDSSQVFTYTFLFPQDILQQPDSLPGWPMREVKTHYRGNFVKMSYGMDPAITKDPAYKEDLLKGMKEIPSVALTMPVEDFTKVHFSDIELPIYLELLYPDEALEAEYAFAGFEGVSHKDQKRSFRLSFKKKYGDKRIKSEIFKEYDLLSGRGATDEFDHWYFVGELNAVGLETIIRIGRLIPEINGIGLSDRNYRDWRPWGPLFTFI